MFQTVELNQQQQSPPATSLPIQSSNVEIIQDGKIVKKVQKARQRKILSCVYCHSKKIKCNRQEPCSQCNKLKVECKYFINERISRGGKKSSRLTAYEKKLRGIDTATNSSSTTMSITENNLELNNRANTSPDSNSSSSCISSGQSLAITSSEATTIEEHINKQNESNNHNRNPSEATPSSTTSTNEFKQPPSVDMSVHFLGFLNRIENNHPSATATTSNNTNIPRISTPNNIDSPLSNDPFALGSMIQSPIINNATNNITNSYFNTNFTTQVNNNPILSSNNNNNSNSTANLISFNSSSFPLANQDILTAFPSGLNSPVVGNSNPPPQSSVSIQQSDSKKDSSPSHQQQQQQQQQSDSLTKAQPNPNLYNSLLAYSSNPATTTVNYLYGTNTYYENSNLLDDLFQFLPPTRERSFELMDRYLNSVHLLLPVVVNMTEFLKQHKRYWDIRSKSKRRTYSSTSSTTSPENNNPLVESPCESNPSSKHHNFDVDFNFVQFYTLYFPILYASTISEFEEYDNLLLNQDIDKYLKGFNKICQYYNYPHGIKTIPLLLGNVIIQSTSPNPSTMEMAQIIRYAKFLHFHKDPYISLRIKDREVIKFRRLLWWVIFGLDALSSHNFCLPPNCRIDDFNVLMPDEEEPKDDTNPEYKKLNLGLVSMNIKFGYDRILSELVYHLHNGLSENISLIKINEIKRMITDYHKNVEKSIDKINKYFTFKTSGNYTIQEINLINFVKSHSWSYVDRALMLLHKKILLGSPNIPGEHEQFDIHINSQLILDKPQDDLTLSKYEDTFGQMLESNIIKNFNNSSISLLKFGNFDKVSYEDLNNNLIPSILHNFNDFLQYNDFIKFGRFNWYIKRTIPIDSVIIMMVIISVKFKYKFIDNEEFSIYKNLINNVLFIINRKWFKNEKYKRMLSLTNMMWEYLIKKYTIKDAPSNTTNNNNTNDNNTGTSSDIDKSITNVHTIDELQLKEKILYDLRHNFIDINDYCSFYSSLENLLNQLLKYIE